MNNSITYLKALGIVLMVLGHCGCSVPYVVAFLSMFHMPLFFFAAGYCFRPDNLRAPKAFFLKRIKGIYWPYVKWGLLFLFMHNFFFDIGFYSETYGYKGSVSCLYTSRDYLIHTYQIITQMCGEEQLLGGYWFLSALFSGYIVAWALLRISSRAIVGGGNFVFYMYYFKHNTPVFR